MSVDFIQLLQQAHEATRQMTALSDDEISRILEDTSVALKQNTGDILNANREDLMRMNTSDPKYDRLRLTEERLIGMADDMARVALLPSPRHRLLGESIRPNGLRIRKVSVPFGVVGIIYEARPNVTTDVYSLCLRSGNVCVLKGGSDADSSIRAIVKVIHEILQNSGVNPSVCTLLPQGRESTSQMLHAVDSIDLIIPRGSASLIRFVRQNAHVPVIETGAGICHTYFDREGDAVKGRDIVNNGKTRRISVCNALDCLIIHKDRLCDLPLICSKLQESHVILYADEPAYAALKDAYPDELLRLSTPESYGTEFLDYKMSIRTVSSIDEALAHIARYGSHHSESIISQSQESIRLFRELVDAACVYSNAPTSFTDGGQFGFGAEIGISTQKLHARGPMGLPELNTYKYIIEGDGQIRPA